MNPIYHDNTRRALQPRAPVARLVGSAVLGALLGISAYAGDMYRPPTNAPGGVPAQSTITSQTITPTNATLCWYGMQGWYSVEAATNLSGPWNSVGRGPASDFSSCMTVTNSTGDTNSVFYRLAQSNGYVGSGACAGCHGDKFTEWKGTAHSSALSSLNAIGMGQNPACLPCHTVGFGQPNGYTDITNTSHLADVGCENCHGPAGWHKYSDHDLIRPAVSIDPKICGGCHQDSHHPTFEEYETTPHAEVNLDIKYGNAAAYQYYTNTFVTSSNTWYGYYVTTNSSGTLITNQTTGIIHSLYGPANNPLYDPGQDRAVGCGICHSAAARMAQLKDYEARLEGYTNALVFPAAKDSAAWSAACATCHDPHSDANPAQLRNPMRSTNYYTMPTTADKRTVYTTNFMGAIKTNVVFYSAAFANMYDPNIQICAQCHNSRGARWDGRSFGYYIAGTLQSVTTNGPGIVWGVQTNVSFSRPPHHSPQYNVLNGMVQPDYFNTNSSGVATNWLQRHGLSVSSSSGAYNTNGCASCHVPSYAVNAGTNVTGHTFEMDTKGCTISGCHGSVPNYEEVQVTVTNSISRVVYLLNQWAVNKGPTLFSSADYNRSKENCWEYSTIGALASATYPGPRDTNQVKLPDAIKQARFNLYMVLHDGSMGIHNPRYVPALITDAENKVMNEFKLANFKANVTVGFAPTNIVFTNLAGAGVVTGYNWSFGDGNTSPLATPTNSYASRGLYSVALTATGASGSETVVRTNYISVYTRPVVSFTGSPRTGTAPLTVNFTNTSTSTNDVTAWRWTINSQNITAYETAYTFTNAGTYNIALRASTPAGSITTTSNAYIVVTAPTP